MEMSKHDVQMLEGYINLYGLTEVISKLSWVCSEKATHVAENWYDVAQGKKWMRYSLLLDRCHVQLEELAD